MENKRASHRCAILRPELSALALPPEAVGLGNFSRLAALGDRLERHGRAEITVGAVGGSSTAGHGLPRSSPELYHGRLLQWMQCRYPAARLSLLNLGTPAVGPAYMEKCAQHELPPSPDLVLVEYAQNVEDRDDLLAYERLLRRLLALPSRPAVIVVELPTWPELLGGVTRPRASFGARGSAAKAREMHELARHYALPHVSLAELLRADGALGAAAALPAAVAPLHRPPDNVGCAMLNLSAGWFQCYTSDDKGNGCCATRANGILLKRPHPNQIGHEMVGALLARLLELAWRRPAGESGGAAAEAAAGAALPPPQLRRDGVPNEALPDEVCIGQAQLRAHVARREGWAWMREGTERHPKLGVGTRTPGAMLELCYPLDALCGARGCWAAPRRTTAASASRVSIGYLRSYAPEMGSVQLSCAGGCRCEPTVLRGWHADRTSTTHIEPFSVSRAPRAEASEPGGCPCTVRLTSLHPSERPNDWPCRPGYCRVTPNVSPMRACETRALGSWPRVVSGKRCEQRCRTCRRCNFVSYSEKERECSWFQECALGALGDEFATGHCTRPVRGPDALGFSGPGADRSNGSKFKVQLMTLGVLGVQSTRPEGEFTDGFVR